MLSVRLAGRRAVGIQKRQLSAALLSLEVEFPGSPVKTPNHLPKPSTEVSTLPNGVKVASIETGGKFASFGLHIKSGSRDESLKEMGATLLLQRLAFRRTAFRSPLRLNRDLENAGVTASCSSGREHTLYTASCMPEAAHVAIGSLFETAFLPNTRDWEVKEAKERVAHLDLAAYESNGDLLLSEAIHAAAFGPVSSLGHPYHAACELDGPGVRRFAAQRSSTPSNITLVGVGVSHTDLVEMAKFAVEQLAELSSDRLGVSPAEMADLAKEHKAEAAAVEKKAPASSPAAKKGTGQYVGGQVMVKAKSALTHVAVAFEGPAAGDKDAAAFHVLEAILKARLASGAPSSTAFTTSYSDTGLFGACGATSPDTAGTLVESLIQIMQGLGSSAPSGAELKAAIASGTVEAHIKAAHPTAAVAVLASAVTSPALEGVSAAAVQAAAKRLTSSPISYAVVGDISVVPLLQSIGSS